MRLLTSNDSGEMQVVEFAPEDIPPYAILSHTWGVRDEEITFNDLARGLDDFDKKKIGYFKIQFCLQQAKRDGLQFAWIDTCCIDRTSSTELNESVRSMHSLYTHAAKCYVYLSDISSHDNATDHDEPPLQTSLTSSKWFERGWTLQEFLASKTTDFFSKEGDHLGNNHTSAQQIFEITGVPTEALRGRHLNQFLQAVLDQDEIQHEATEPLTTIAEPLDRKQSYPLTDSGYGGSGDAGQNTSNSAISVRDSFSIIRSQDSGIPIVIYAGNERARLPNKGPADADAMRRVVPCHKDIGSRKGVNKIPEVITAEKHLERFLCRDDRVLALLRPISMEDHANDLQADIRELLKYYYIDLKVEARTNLEVASANLLRGHWYRDRIARRIVCRLTGIDEDLSEDDAPPKTNERSLYDLNQWLQDNQGFDDPNEDWIAPPEDNQLDENTMNGDNSEDEDYMSQAFQELNYIKRMEHFMFNGSSFQKLLEQIQTHTIIPRYHSLRRILMSLPIENVRFHNYVAQSVLDRLLCDIERRSTKVWDWWPLHEPVRPLTNQQCRLSWKCHCGREHYNDLPQSEAAKFETLLDLRCLHHNTDHLCAGRQAGRRSWRQFLHIVPFSTTSEAQRSPTPHDGPQMSSHSQSSSATTHAISGGHRKSSGNPQRISVKSNSSTQPGGVSTGQHSGFTIQIGQGNNDLRVVLGIKGKRRCLDVDQIELNGQVKNDGELVSKITTAHNEIRGWLRLWFSVYQLRFYTFKKFLKYRRNRFNSIQDGIPEGDVDYEYKDGSMTPPAGRPPITKDEFEDSFPCAMPCYYWLWPWHECIEPLTERRLYQCIPKKKSLWALDCHGDSIAWGLESGHKISFVHVVTYHFILVGSTFGFWGWWQSRFPQDMQGAAVPITVILALLSVFWQSTGLLKSPEGMLK